MKTAIVCVVLLCPVPASALTDEEIQQINPFLQPQVHRIVLPEPQPRPSLPTLREWPDLWAKPAWLQVQPRVPELIWQPVTPLDPSMPINRSWGAQIPLAPHGEPDPIAHCDEWEGGASCW